MATMMMDRGSMTGMGTQMGVPGVGTAAGVPTNMMMVPRCKVTFEKCQGGLKVNCVCDDQTARSMMQSLCTMLQGGMCSLLHGAQRDDGLLLQPDHGHVQVRHDQGRLLRHLHLGRPEVR